MSHWPTHCSHRLPHYSVHVYTACVTLLSHWPTHCLKLLHLASTWAMLPPRVDTLLVHCSQFPLHCPHKLWYIKYLYFSNICTEGCHFHTAYVTLAGCHTAVHTCCHTVASHTLPDCLCHTLPHCLCHTAPSPINLCGPSLIPNSSFAFKFSEETTRSCSIGNWSRTKKHQLKTLQENKTALTSKLWTLFGHGLKSVWKNLKSLSLLKC